MASMVTATIRRNRRSTGTRPACSPCSSIVVRMLVPVAAISSAKADSLSQFAACVAFGQSPGRVAYLIGVKRKLTY